MFGRKEFSSVFTVGDEIASGSAVTRKNATRLEVLALEDLYFRYKPKSGATKHQMKYSYLAIVLDGYAELNPWQMQKSVNAVLKKRDFKPNYSTENYAYAFARAYVERSSDVFIGSGEFLARSSESDLAENHIEGARMLIQVERIERSNKARNACIKHHGPICKACGFDFEQVYGDLGSGFMHVHHQGQALARSKGKHEVDPTRDLVPLCPNCHAMVHHRTPMLPIPELKALLQQKRL